MNLLNNWVLYVTLYIVFITIFTQAYKVLLYLFCYSMQKTNLSGIFRIKI